MLHVETYPKKQMIQDNLETVEGHSSQISTLFETTGNTTEWNTDLKALQTNP